MRGVGVRGSVGGAPASPPAPALLVGAVLGVFVLLLAVLGTPAASAETPSPWWGITAGSEPTSLVRGGSGEIVVTAQNRGDAPTSGQVTIADRLPTGLEATAIAGVAGEAPGDSGNRGPVSCVLATLTCTFGAAQAKNPKGEEVAETLRPYEQIEVDIAVSVGPVSKEAQDSASVSGGGAASGAIASHALAIDGRERFGVEYFQLAPESADGSTDTQAGSHPFQLTSVIALNTAPPEREGHPRTVALVKELAAELPAGLIGEPAGIAQCSQPQFEALLPEPRANGHIANECPAQSAVGVATMTFYDPGLLSLDTVTAPIFEMAPLPGEPTRFGVKAAGIVSVFVETAIRSGGDYGVTLTTSQITEEAWLLSMKLTLWGVPGDPSHDGQRGWECLEEFGACQASTGTSPPPLLSLPTSCQAPFQATARGESWGTPEQPAEQAEPVAYRLPQTLDGCNRLPFAPQLEVAPEAQRASSPSGLDVDVRLPQSTAADPEAPVEAPVKDITVALPEGVALNPAGAGGLEACSEGLAGFEGFRELHPEAEPGGQTPLFTPGLPEPLEQGVNFCLDASKLGTVKIATPLVPGPLRGSVYLASPQNLRDGPSENPFGSLVAVYVIAKEPVSGVVVKLPGELSLDPRTGRITATFQNTPQLPLQEIDLDFFGGGLAPLSAPARCGTYTTDASFEPWSGGEPVSSQSSFQIASGPNGGPCPGATLPFAPSLSAGTTSLAAGGYSPLTVTVGREDGQQAIESVKLKLPPGLTANIADVTPCGEAQANAGGCGPESEIGETTLSAGLGSDPLTISGGRVYLTGPYGGAPFGLAIVAPARVGPFVLQEGRPIVIRAKLEIDPQTAALTIATGAGAIPTIVEGFPLQIKRLNIAIGGLAGKPGFTINPTNCAPMAIEGAIGGSEGALAIASAHFQVANCAGLYFKPKLTAITKANGEFQGHGASLHVAIQTSSGGANLRSLKLDLPQRLPARLQSVQQACPESVFNADRAACPKASVVGSASVATPVLAGLLSGPAYLVAKDAAGGSGGAGTRARVSGSGADGGGSAGAGSRAGAGGSVGAGNPEAAFPDLVLTLQGGGVKIDLTGGLYVSEQNVTSATFRSLPDVPIRRLDLVLPEGPRSILAASSGLCTKKPLTMLAAIGGQNGAKVKPTVKVGVEGCKKKKKAKKRRSKKLRHSKKTTR